MASLVAFIALAGVGLSAGVTVISVVQHSRERRQQQLKEYRKSLCRHWAGLKTNDPHIIATHLKYNISSFGGQDFDHVLAHQDRFGQTIFHELFENRDYSFIDALLSLGVPLGSRILTIKNKKGNTFFHRTRIGMTTEDHLQILSVVSKNVEELQWSDLMFVKDSRALNCFQAAAANLEESTMKFIISKLKPENLQRFLNVKTIRRTLFETVWLANVNFDKDKQLEKKVNIIIMILGHLSKSHRQSFATDLLSSLCSNHRNLRQVPNKDIQIITSSIVNRFDLMEAIDVIADLSNRLEKLANYSATKMRWRGKSYKNIIHVLILRHVKCDKWCNCYTEPWISNRFE